MTVTSGGKKGTMGRYMVTGTIVVEIERSTSLLSVGMGSASDIEAYVDADVMLRGRGSVMGVVQCIIWLHPVSDEGQWFRIWDATYDNAINIVE